MIDPTFTENSRRIFDLRYPRKDAEGLPTETPAEVITRVATNVASVGALYYGMDKAKRAPRSDHADYDAFPYRTARRQYDWLKKQGRTKGTFEAVMHAGEGVIDNQARQYAEIISDWKFLPNSPTWTGAGTPLGQLAACFVLPIVDDLGRRRDSIFGTLNVAALIQQTGGGNGFSFGKLRPKNSIIKTSMGRATGPVGFMKTYDAAFGNIGQGGSRSGANMAVLPVSHPDIREFMLCKTVEGEIANFNISVALTDEFMQAVEDDGIFELTFEGQWHERVQARDLFHEIAENAWIIGDPGNLFIDRAHDTNPCPTRYTIEATNPCGEQYLGPYENCCLGSISLNKFVTKWFTLMDDGAIHEYGTFDWEEYARVIRLATFFLDDVVDANQYVPAVPELEAAAQGGRRIGLGLMGAADAMAMMGVRYGSTEGEQLLAQFTEFARYHSMCASIERARLRGPFEWIEGSIYDPAGMREHGPGGVMPNGVKLWDPPASQFSPTLWGMPHLDWGFVVDGIAAFGIRNCCQFTFAPTGTISNVAALEGSGLEPFFALIYKRWVTQFGERLQLDYFSPLLAYVLEEILGYDAETCEVILHKVGENHGSIQGINEIPVGVQWAFPVAADVTWKEHIRMQAAAQRWVDNSISKTINMPKVATVADVEEAYMMAWKSGCKGITIYRQGSRDIEVLSTGPTTPTVESQVEEALKTTIAQLEAKSHEWPHLRPMPQPASIKSEGLAARVYPVESFYGNVQVTITSRTPGASPTMATGGA
jgi:ribonucleoside-diphosphate reductase alpha chain